MFKPSHSQPEQVTRYAAELEAVRDFAANHGYEAEHTLHVTKLALRLFDQLRGPLHLTDRARRYLEYAALLHDIAALTTSRAHHKQALREIVGAKALPFTLKQRRVIGCIGRYHRGALPSKRQRHFAALPARCRRAVVRLAAILRLADGMDNSHTSVVSDLVVEQTDKRLIVRAVVLGPATAEKRKAAEKSDLMGKVASKLLHRKLVLEWIKP